MHHGLFRECYWPSGRLSGPLLFRRGLVALAIAGGSGVVLGAVRPAGFSLFLLAPLLASLVPLVAVAVAVRTAHCRNRLAAGALGVVAGLVLYLCSYQTEFARVAGLRNAYRVDRLPAYMQQRMRMNGAVAALLANGPQPGMNPAGVVTVNWVMFGAELAAICLILAGTGVRCAGLPYNESAQRWLRRETALFSRRTGEALADALDTGTLTAWVEAEPRRVMVSRRCAVVTLHYDALSLLDEAAPVYLTVHLRGLSGLVSLPGDNSRTLLYRVRLSAEEARTLKPMFGSLVGICGPTPTPPEKEQRGGGAGRPTPSAGGPTARVEQVPDAEVRQLVSRAYVWRLAFVALGLWFLVLLCVCGLVAVVVLAVRGIILGQMLSVVVAWLLAVATLLGLFGTSKLVPVALGWLDRWLYRAARRGFHARPDRLVDVDDPEAVFVDVFPRPALGQPIPRVPQDLGFLRIDNERGLLLFEGGQQRYQIPAAAVFGCDVEQVAWRTLSIGASEQPDFLALLRANAPDGVFEVCFRVRYDAQHLFGDTRAARARQLQALILSGLVLTPETQQPADGRGHGGG